MSRPACAVLWDWTCPWHTVFTGGTAQLKPFLVGLQVAELKQQLRVLQAVGFGAVEGDSAPGIGTLEVQLLAKLRGLEHQLTMARLQEASSAGALWAFSRSLPRMTLTCSPDWGACHHGGAGLGNAQPALLVPANIASAPACMQGSAGQVPETSPTAVPFPRGKDVFICAQDARRQRRAGRRGCRRSCGRRRAWCRRWRMTCCWLSAAATPEQPLNRPSRQRTALAWPTDTAPVGP